MATMASGQVTVRLSYEIRPDLETWVLPEVPVPESTFHDRTVGALRDLLSAWVERGGTLSSGGPESVLVARNLAVRWLQDHPSVGVDPDLCVVAPAPSEKDIDSLCLWKPGHKKPRIAFEVVSKNHPYKDYARVQDKYAALGVDELWVLDPLLFGPTQGGGPFAIQLWQVGEDGSFERSYAGSEPAWSRLLGAWISVTHDGQVRITEDQTGERPWLNREQLERAARERERVAKEVERAAKESALARVAELERELSRARDSSS